MTTTVVVLVRVDVRRLDSVSHGSSILDGKAGIEVSDLVPCGVLWTDEV
jgi:hypothetical protein